MLNKLTVKEAIALLQATPGVQGGDLSSHSKLGALRKRLAKEYHPDLGGAPGVFQKINSAINLLLDQPERDLPDAAALADPLNALRVAVKEARDHGFFRIQIRSMEPYPSMFWRQTGYFGSAIKSQTARRTGKTRQSDEDVVAALLRYIGYTAQKVGQTTAPEDLIVKITVQAPRGRNTGHFAVAWKTQQDDLAQMFGHSERWYSITMDMPPGDSKKWLARGTVDQDGKAAASVRQSKKEKWDRSKVIWYLLNAGLIRVSSGERQERWAPRGTLRSGISKTPHLIVSSRTIKPSSSYMGRQFYWGELTRLQLEGLVRSVGGMPPTEGDANRLGQAVFVQPSDVPIKKARAIAQILATNGSGTHEIWEMMDAWVAADGLGSVLATIGRIYEINGSEWSTGEQNWWISQLS